MKVLYIGIGALLLLLSLAGPAFAQTPSAGQPPVKMGLWHEEVTTTITGIQGVTPTPQKDVEQSCISPESWKKYGLQAANSNRCTMSNLHQDAHKMSYDASCGSQKQGLTIFHVEMLIDSDQHMHGTVAAKIAAPGVTHSGTWTSTVSEHYIGPDCGELKPGERKSLKQ